MKWYQMQWAQKYWGKEARERYRQYLPWKASRKQEVKERKQREVNMSKYHPPEYKGLRFQCLHCQAYAHQHWDTLSSHKTANMYKSINIDGETVEFSACSSCYQPTFWADEKIIYPLIGIFPAANEDLPESVKEIYSEAANIANQSSRAACALLRYAIELLLKHLGETGSINESIKNLVKKGLDVRVQQSLDIVRVTGNNAVHPGEIGFDDTTDVEILFQLINIIANVLITQPKQIQEAYDNLPDNARKAIKKRDSKT